jgi:hypothetical protein
MKIYDLVLVVGYFRSAGSFLSVVRALSGAYRIAVLLVESDPAMRQKTGRAHDTFVELCRRFGADILLRDETAETHLMIVQQFHYSDELAKAIRRDVSASHCIALLTLATAGLERHDRFLNQFEIKKAYVPSRRFMEFLLNERKANARYEGVDVAEVGLPFRRHPVFPDFSCDWLIAAPTLFSFHTEKSKQHFLRTVDRLLSQIPPTELVVYKSHNSNSLDYFAPRIHYLVAGALEKIPGGKAVLRATERLPFKWLRKQVQRVETCILHRRILRRARPMTEQTAYAGLALEAFLPGVRKGVIGGLSNTIWGTLYFDLPFYNCVDEQLRQGQSELQDRRSDALLDTNLRYFGVPFCEGDLGMDTRKLKIVGADDRRGDLVSAILTDMDDARFAHKGTT